MQTIININLWKAALYPWAVPLLTGLPMPSTLTSTPLKIGAFTAVTSAFSVGIAAIALTHTAPEPPFGGAPVIEVQLFQSVGMSAPATTMGRSQPSPAIAEVQEKPAREAATDINPAPTNKVPVSEPTAQIPISSLSTSNPFTNSTAQSSSRTPATSPMAGSAASGDERKGAATQGAQGAQQSDDYEAQVIRWLDAHKKHPGRLAGVVTIRFVVDRRGRLRDSVITKSSGDPRLDRIAQQQIREAAPLPRAPRDAAWQTREITVSLDYRRHI